MQQQTLTATLIPNRLYLAVWRWHFYAGLFVIPFLMVLACSGMLMLLKDPLESYQYGHLLYVEPDGRTLAPQAQLAAVARQYPHSVARLYVPPRSVDSASQFAVSPAHGAHGDDGHSDHAESTITVFVDPYSGRVLGELDPAQTLYAWANTLHASLFLGDAGDYLIEIAAGFGVLLTVSGVFLWWPRDGRWRDAILPRIAFARRPDWRNLHAALGFWLAGALLFFLISGLTWTSVWGGKLTQAWNSFPAEKSAPLAEKTHGSLNRPPLDEVPWVLEQTPMPASGSRAGSAGIADGVTVDLDSIVALAKQQGFEHFRVNIPRAAEDVWTISAAAMAGDVVDPRDERTVHVDRHSGRVLADVGFTDYSLLGKAMTLGVPLHQGSLGVWNIVINLCFCLAVIAMTVTGIVMWWLRRPVGRRGIVPPPLPSDLGAWKRAIAAMFVLSLGFPLVAITIAAVIALDLLVIARIPALRMLLR